MDECCSNEDASSKMPGEKYESVRDREGGKSSRDDWKGTCYASISIVWKGLYGFNTYRAESEDNDNCQYM